MYAFRRGKTHWEYDLPHLCFVCSGNTCRSPVAASVLRAHAERAGLAVRVSSGGTGPWHAGERLGADPYSGASQEYEQVLAKIEAAMPGLLEWSRGRMPGKLVR
jgi:protein-tyrosine-phosphatase